MSDTFDNLLFRYEAIISQPYCSNTGADLLLCKEIVQTRKALFRKIFSTKNDTKIKILFSMSVQQLTEICDGLFEHSGKNTGDSNIACLLENLGKLRKAMPQLVDRDIALPKVFRIIQGKQFEQQWVKQIQAWRTFPLSDELLEIAALPILEFGSLNQKLSWFHFVWLKRYLNLLSTLDLRHYAPYPSCGHQLHELLIRLDFNHPRFTGYCFRQIQLATDQFSEKTEQLYVLRMTEKLVSQYSMLSTEPFFKYSSSVATDICDWIVAEEKFRQDFDPDFFKETGERQPVNEWKFQHELNVEQLSFWYKLQYDHGIFKKEKLRNFCKRLSYNCATASNELVTDNSFWSKLYTKDINVIGPVFDCIKRMITELQGLLDILHRMESELLPYVKYRDRRD